MTTRPAPAFLRATLVAVLVLPGLLPLGAIHADASPANATEEVTSPLIPPSPTGRARRDRHGTWAWPTGGESRVLRPFAPPAQRWLAGHRGVDLDAGVGDTVVAPVGGRVIHAGPLAGRNVVSIDSGTHRVSLEPVAPIVEVGQEVERGEVLGVVEAGHEPSGLHWGVRTSSGRYVNPLRFIVPAAHLLPW